MKYGSEASISEGSASDDGCDEHWAGGEGTSAVHE